MAKLELLEYHRAAKLLTATTSPNLVFFKDQTAPATGEWNTLGTDGILPDNGTGELMGVQVSNATKQSLADATYKQSEAFFYDLINTAQFELVVSGVKVVSGPLFEFCRPPEWYSGNSAKSTADGTYPHGVQNGGWAMGFLRHPLHARASIQARVFMLGGATVNTAAVTDRLEIILQTRTFKEFA